MFWTLVVMTLGGTPIPTDLVFDSIDACYEAEASMYAERSRHATEWMARSTDNRQMPDFVRQNLMRGVCIPHEPVKKTDNLPATQMKIRRDPDHWYPLSALAGRGSGAPTTVATPVQVFIAPRLDYRLPKVPMSFRILVRNQSDSAITVRNPLQSFYMIFQKPDGFPIEMPTRVPEIIVQRMDSSSDRPLRGPSHVAFRTAIVNGKEDREERNDYRIESGSSLEFIFECEKVISERILAALEDHDPKKGEAYVDLSVTMSLLSPDSAVARMLRQEEKIRLPVPKP